jgi:hypothetical protein
MNIGEEILKNATRVSGDYSGVFEYDGKTSYFYLYTHNEVTGHKVIDAIHIFSGTIDFVESDICVQWQQHDKRVGLFLEGVLWAVFNLTTGNKYGGDYSDMMHPQVPLNESWILKE